MNLSLGLCGSFQRFHLRQPSFLFLGFRGIPKSLIDCLWHAFMQRKCGKHATGWGCDLAIRRITDATQLLFCVLVHPMFCLI